MALKQVLTFSTGTVFGFSFAYFWIGIVRWQNTFLLPFAKSNLLISNGHEDASFSPVKDGFIGTQPSIVYEVDKDVALNLAEKVRILCWIVTSSENFKGARVVKATWGKRCDVLIFTSTKEKEDLPAISLNITEDLPYLLWRKTKKGFDYIYRNYLNSADWFLKADDRNYIIMENLKHMLHPHSPDQPLYFGRKFLKHSKQGYMSGGAGYVLSREAVRRFVELGLTNPDKCRTTDGGQEDLELGICLENVGVVAGDSRDHLGRGRFFPFDPATHAIPELIADIQWYWEYTNISFSEGVDCCSDTSISFHHVFPELMYIYDYLIYDLHSRKIN